MEIDWNVIGDSFSKWFGIEKEEVCTVVIEGVIYVFSYEELMIK